MSISLVTQQAIICYRQRSYLQSPMQLSSIANAAVCILKRNAVHLLTQSGALAHTMPNYHDGTEHEMISSF